MKALLRFVGRLLFVTLLLSSAVLKIKQPTSYTTDVTQGYDSIRGLHSSLSDILPSTNTVALLLWPRSMPTCPSPPLCGSLAPWRD